MHYFYIEPGCLEEDTIVHQITSSASLPSLEILIYCGRTLLSLISEIFQAHKYREPEIFSLRMIFILTDRFVETDCYALLPKPWSAGQNDFQESEPLVQTDFSGISSWRHYGAKSVTFLSESLIRARRHNCFIKSTARTFLVMYHLVTPERSLTESTKMYSSIKQIPAFPILTRAGFWRWPGFDCIQIPTQLSIW